MTLPTYFDSSHGKPPPNLHIQQAMWSMKRYGDNGREWPLEKKFEQIAAAGFDGIFGSLPEPGEKALWSKLMEEHSFSFGLESFPSSRSDLRALLERASDFDILYVNAQVKDSFTTGPEAVGLLEELLEEADRFRIPFYVETHRGRITQDLIRTAEYVDRIPGLRLTIDLSHYVLAGEMYHYTLAEPYFEKLLQRTSSIHGRVTNGQQIQIDMGPDGGHPAVEPFVQWWSRGMGHWLKQARPGHILPFVCEIGHHYSVTPSFLPGTSADEISDRWKQSLVMKRLAEQAWDEACSG